MKKQFFSWIVAGKIQWVVALLFPSIIVYCSIALDSLLELTVEDWIIFIALLVGSAGIFCLPYTMTRCLYIYLLYLPLQAYFLFGFLLFALCSVANKCL